MDDVLKALRKELEQLEKEGLPKGYKGFSGRYMPGTAFFPGGDGLWKSDPGVTVSFPYQGVLILGSDFGDADSYDMRRERRREFPHESDGPTWKNLPKLMKLAGIGPEQWFCTNAWPCLREGSRAVGGKPPGAKAPPGAKDAFLEFTNRCVKFFQRTRELMRPRLIVPLGLEPAAFLTKACHNAPSPWGTARSWRQIDTEAIWRTDDCVIVPIVHPSMENSNRRHRPKYNTPEAEAALVREAWAMTNMGQI